MRRDLDPPAGVPPVLRRRQLCRQAAGRHPRPRIDGDHHTVAALLTVVPRRAPIGIIRTQQQRLALHIAVAPQLLHIDRREITVPHRQVEVIAVVAVLALDQVHIVERFAVPPAPQLIEEPPPDVPHLLEGARQVIVGEGQRVAPAVEAEQRQQQLQPIHAGAAHGGVSRRAEDLVLLRPLEGAVVLAQPRPDRTGLLDQRAGPLPAADPARGITHTTPAHTMPAAEWPQNGTANRE